jgi:hypothetical protein
MTPSETSTAKKHHQKTKITKRTDQLERIQEELKLGRHFFSKYDKKEDAIVVGNERLVLTLFKTHLDRDDYMDVVKYAYGRYLEALDNDLLQMPVAGHA